MSAVGPPLYGHPAPMRLQTMRAETNFYLLAASDWGEPFRFRRCRAGQCPDMY
jgi:hypothetical protein